MDISFLNKGPKTFCRFRQVFKDLALKIEQLLDLKHHFVVDVAIVDNSQMQELNKKYRQINETTDVLSFPFYEKAQLDSLTKTNDIIHLGEIIISHEEASKEATNNNYSLAHEMRLLFIHGFLHLLGYDHYTKEEEKEMFAIQKTLLEKGEKNEKT
ncbi:MAG: rRNA maturation RNase YbeY [Erysipelotrichia bacterium]|jgi:probable rRNA maturation factor|nr:rRNA maturation RNase YbeY [Erysipelotrichia bacterium]